MIVPSLYRKLSKIGVNDPFNIQSGTITGGPATWGLIVGSIAAQGDLISSLNAKADLVAGKIPVSQLPNAIMEYQGTWNATTNTPTLADGATGTTAGNVYKVSVAGTQDFGSGAIAFTTNDYVIYNGTTWEKSENYSDSTIQLVIDGGGFAIVTGSYVDINVRFACTITGWVALNVTRPVGGSDTFSVELRRCTYSAYDNTHPDSGDKISASAPITIGAGLYKATDSTNTGWTKTLAVGDIIRFYVNSCVGATNVSITLNIVRS